MDTVKRSSAVPGTLVQFRLATPGNSSFGWFVSGAQDAAFEEDLKGTLTAGKLADIVVLSKDIMTIPEDEIPNAEVVHTIVGGQVVYSAPP